MENPEMIGNSIILLGILTIFIGFMILALSTVSGNQSKEQRKNEWGENSPGRSKQETYSEKPVSEVKSGGVIMLGPIPIIFGSDTESAKSAMIMAIILMLLAIVIFR